MSDFEDRISWDAESLMQLVCLNPEARPKLTIEQWDNASTEQRDLWLVVGWMLDDAGCEELRQREKKKGAPKDASLSLGSP
jgi:hypothetical protein